MDFIAIINHADIASLLYKANWNPKMASENVYK